MASDILETSDGALRIVSMNRPDRRNALNVGLSEALLDAVGRAAADPDVGAVLLRGEGPAFCVGGDVKDMAEGKGRSASLNERIALLRQRMDVVRVMHDMPKPAIAAIHGAAAGAGLSLALACDFRFAARSAKITTAFAKVGLSGDYGGSWFLTRIVGTARARDLYLRPRVLTADEALAMGLVSEVVADDELDAFAREHARQIASGPRVVMGYIKRNLNRAETSSLGELLDQEAMHHTLSSLTDDHKEAAQAFVEKRTPVFTGR